MTYFRLELLADLGPEYVIDGEKKGAEQLNNEEYEIMNDDGIVIEMKDV